MKLTFQLLVTAIVLMIFNGCDQEDSMKLQPGQISFSYEIREEALIGGRVVAVDVPAFASYTMKSSDGSLISDKIPLYDFNGDFISLPSQLHAGHYTLEQFLILNSDNQVIYASPIEGSELAGLVEHPLPLSIDITAEEITNVVPEVLALGIHSPGDFGYVVFGFEVVDTFDLDVTTTIADNAQHPSINYTLEVIAKDTAFGIVQWSKTFAMNALDDIRLPSKYNHYTFKAIKQGYIPHIQHILKADLAERENLTFEFLPVSLDDFIVREQEGATVYMAKNPCKLYARVDMHEGYELLYFSVDRFAVDHMLSTTNVADFRVSDHVLVPGVNMSINLWGNTPYMIAEDYCSTVDLTRSSLNITMNDVFYTTFFYLDTNPNFFSDEYTWWTQGNIGGSGIDFSGSRF